MGVVMRGCSQRARLRAGRGYAAAIGTALVEQLVAQAAVEGLGEAVLHRLARRNVMPVDTVIVRPLQDRIRGQLSAIVVKRSSSACRGRQ